MKITIRSETEEQEPTMELWLNHWSEGIIMLRGKDQNGCVYNLVEFSKGGIYLCSNITAAGWPLDAKGRLKVGSR